jgi:hypothetical protein
LQYVCIHLAFKACFLSLMYAIFRYSKCKAEQRKRQAANAKRIFCSKRRIAKIPGEIWQGKNFPVRYSDLLNYRFRDALKDKNGKLTHWETVHYDLKEMEFLRTGLVQTYAMLKTEGNERFSIHLDVERIDFCEFGNSAPFRIRIINRINGNYDHFYIKQADASRIYGLELEHLYRHMPLFFNTRKIRW